MSRRARTKIHRAASIEPLEPRIQLSAIAFSAFTNLDSSAPQQVISADLRGIGRNDLIISNPSHSQFNVFLANGDGTFKSPTSVADGNGSFFIAAADVNGDGKLDIIASDNADNTVSVLLGNGDGTFKAPKTFAVANAPYYIATGDFNGDGKTDIVTADANGVVTVLINQGNSSFVAANFPGAENSGGLVVADLNHDHHLDIIETDDSDNSVAVLLGNANGTFKAPIVTSVGGSYPRGLAVADFDGDGTPDVVTANENSQTLSVLLGLGNGHFGSPSTVAVGSAPVAVAAPDINRDGKPDIVVADQTDNNIRVFESNGSGHFSSTPTLTLATDSDPVSIVAADFNGDGVTDLATANGLANSVSVLLNTYVPPTRLATFSGPTALATHSGYLSRSVASGDFNGDGNLDLVTTSQASNDLTVLLGNGDGTFKSPTQVYAGGDTYSVAVGDINGDGKLDIVVTEPAKSALAILYGNSNGTFKPPVMVHLANVPAQVVLADIDGDGELDAVTGSPDGTITALLAIGQDGQKTVVSHAGNEAIGLATADLDENGIPDIIATDPSTDQIHILLGDGNGHFTAPINYSVGNDPTSAAVADFNGDGNPDIAVANNGSGTVSILFGETAGGVTAIKTYAVANVPISIAIGDVNDDGAPDIVTTSQFGGNVSILRSNRNGTFLPLQTCAAGNSPTSVIIADLNGDNRPDIVTADNTSSAVDVLLNTGGAAVSQTTAIVSAAQKIFVVGAAGTFTISTTGSPNAAITETGSLPAGVTLTDNGNGTATLAGTPASGAGGSYTFTIAANNGVSTPARQSFTLTVDQAPAFTSAGSAAFSVGTGGIFTITTNGFPTAEISETNLLPAGVTFTDNHNSSATIAGTPDSLTGGNYFITLQATNGVGAAVTQNFALSVGLAATITSANQATFLAGTPDSFSIKTTGAPTPSITESGPLPSGVTLFDNGDGTAQLSGTSSAGAGGSYPITLSATNGIGAAVHQTFTLTVDQAPAITSSDAVTLGIGTAAAFVVTTTGFPIPALMESGDLPPGMSIRSRANGWATISGTPTTPGVYDIKLNDKNGIGARAVQELVITVTNAPQFTSADNARFAVGAAGTFIITATGTPAPALSTSSTLPAGLTLHDNGNGTATLSGTPTTSGFYDVAVIAKNGLKPNAKQTLTLRIQGPPAFQSSDSLMLGFGNPASFVVATSSAPVAAITTTGTLPPGVTLHDNGDGTANFVGTPSALGAYRFHIVAANKFGIAKQAFTFDVVALALITSPRKETILFGQPSSFTITTTGFPIAAISETGALPSGLTFLDNGNGTATLSGTPADFTDDVYPLTIMASNMGSADAQAFTLKVVAPPTIAFADPTNVINVLYPDGAIAWQVNPFPDAPFATPQVAMADFNGDGVPDLVVAAGAGDAPVVVVYDGKTHDQIASFEPFPSTFLGGLFLATGDVNDDGTPDIVIAPGAGIGPGVLIYNGKNFNLMGALLAAYPMTYTGGVAVATTDFNHDGHADIVTVENGAGQQPTVKIFDGEAILQGNRTVLGSFNPYEATYTGGAFIATGDVNDDGTPDIIVSPSLPGVPPDVDVMDGKTLNRIAAFQTFNPAPSDNVDIFSQDVNNDGFSDIIAVQYPTADVQIFSGKDDSVLSSFTLPDAL